MNRISLGLILFSLFVSLLITDQVFRGGFIWDQTLLDWYAAHRIPILNHIAFFLAFAGGTKILPLMTCFAAWFVGKKNPINAYFLTSSVAGSLLLNLMAKFIFERPRPEQAMIIETGYSFPSGHTMANMAFGLAILCLLRNIWGFLALVWGILVSLSRNYLGVHYPTDVLIGCLWSCLLITVLTHFFFKNHTDH